MRFKLLVLALPIAAIAAPLAAQDVQYVPGTGAQGYASADEGYADERYDDAAYDDDAYARDDSQAGMGQIAGRLSDPAVQDGIAIMVERVSGAVLNMPIGGVTDAIETARPGTVKRRLRRDATVGDLAGRDAEYLPEELGGQTREVVGMMGGVARAMANMMPAFENLGRDMQDQIRVAKEEARRARNR
jgi:hypothetical protein